MSQPDGSSTPEDSAESTTPRKTKRKQRKHPKLFAFFKWSAIACTVMFVILVVAGYIFYRSVDIPSANAEFQTETTYVYYSDGKTVLGKFETQNRESVDLDQVPNVMQNAAIAAEDRTFYENRGIDVQGIVRAAMNNATSDSTQGASTITQQYVKILYLTQDQTYTRKLREAVLSLKLHNQRSKEEILQGYLNTIYFGRGAYGVQTAAQAFFGIDVEDLNLKQSAVLASVLNNPSGYDPANGKAAKHDLKERYDYVLNGMADMDAIPEAKAERAQRHLPKFPDIETKDRFAGPKGYLLRMVEQKLHDLNFSDSEINGGGLKVVTTFDKDDQRYARKSVREQQRATGRNEAVGKTGMGGLHIGLASIDNDTGALRAMYGGPNYLKTQFNWAEAGAQPGSNFKVYALAAALENGYGLDTSLNGSSPYYLPDGSDIENEGDSGGESFGPVSLLYATEKSINTAYVDLMVQMGDGAKQTIRAARQAGIPTKEVFTREQRRHPVPVTPLGYAPVSVIDNAAGYSTFANGGVQNDWYVIESVEDSDGLSHEHHDRGEREFSEDVAGDVMYALQQVVSTGTGTNATTICPTAGKTGTATATKAGSDIPHVSSAWFTGMTPELTTSVMYARGPNGNGDVEYVNQEKGDYSAYLPEFYGGSYPAYTFKSYMDKALGGTECGEFPERGYVEGDEGEEYVPPDTSTPENTFEPTGPTGRPHTDGPTNTGPPDNSTGPPDNSTGPPDNSTGPPDNSTGPPDNSTGPPDNSTGPPDNTVTPPGDGGDNGNTGR